MNWLILSHLLGFGVVVLLFGEGLSIIVRTGVMPYVRWLGVLTIFIAALGGIGQALSFWSVFVFSPEFGLVMVQGELARLGLSAIIFGLAVTFGFTWHLARAAAAWPSRLLWLLMGGVLVGVVSNFCLQLLNPEEAEPFFVVYAYNLWCPPLLIWFGVCLIEIYATLLRIKNRWACRWLATLGVAGLSLLALHQPGLSESLQVFWIACLLLIVPINTILAMKKGFGWIWLALPLRVTVVFFQLKMRLRKLWSWLNLGWMIIATIIVSSLFGLLLALIFGLRLILNGEPFANDRTFSVLFSVSAFGFWLGWLLLAFGLADGPPRFYQKQQTNNLKESRFSLHQVVLMGSFGFMAFSLIGFFYFAAIDPSVALIIFFLAWTLLSEVTTRGLLHQLWQKQREGKLLNKETRDKFYNTGKWLGDGLRRLTDVPHAPVMVVKVLLGLVILIILSEVVNAGKVSIQPFSAFGFKNEDYGEVIANHIFVNLGLLTQQLQPDIIIPSTASTGKSDKQKPKFSYVTLTSSNIDAALVKSADLDLFGVKIPLSLLVTPLQQPIRSLLGVNIINGNVQQDGNKYTVRAYSNQDMTWQVNYSTVSTSLAADKNFAQKVELTDAEILSNLAEEIAFNIIWQEPSLATMGMTHSWEAFRAFQAGIRVLDNGKYDDLTVAIKNFREATVIDPNFALAYYRLGLVLQLDGQPAAAAAAFRASLTANPNFAAGYNTLAYHLYNFDSYAIYSGNPAAAFPPLAAYDPTRQARNSEARRLWQRVVLLPKAMVALPDRASAYYGLCLYSVNYEESTQLAYFYCQQAERLYQEFPSALRSTPSIKQAEASVLTLLGVILSKTDNIYYVFPTNVWTCYGSYYKSQGQLLPLPVYHSIYQVAALQYHQRALVLQPDDTIIRCNVASSAYAQGDSKLMEELADDPKAHLTLADDYSNLAKQTLRENQDLSSRYYRLALKEYQQAIDLDPDNTSALNNYAYNFWVWRYHMPQAEPPLGPDSDIADSAEQYARKAVKLASNKYSSVDEEIVRSTLGEVLLGKGRPEEAIEVLRYAIDKKMLQQHPLYNEIRWDLAQAYLCAAYNAQVTQRPPEEIKSLTEKALPILDQIRQNEQDREYQPIAAQPELLDPLFTPSACLRKNAFRVEPIPSSTRALYVLAGEQPDYEEDINCDRMGVVAQVYPGNDDPWLHIWGGGIDNYVDVSNGTQADIFLADQPRSSYNYYFVQLENGERNPISKVYSFETYGKNQDGCSKNLIKLNFERQR